MRYRIRRKLVLLSVGLLLVVSLGFTALSLRVSFGWVEEDLRARAIAFAREVAATIGDRREFESGGILSRQIRQILEVRQNVLHLDIMAFTDQGTVLVASSHPTTRLPFDRADGDRIRAGQVVSRLVHEEGRYWEVMAPIRLEGDVAGAVAAKFSLESADRLAARIRRWSFALTAASALVTGLLVSVAVRLIVDRPVRRFMEAIERIRRGETHVVVRVGTADEFGVLAAHFNDMVARISRFSEELHRKVDDATAELDRRYREVQRLNEVLFRLQRSLGHAERLALAGRIMAEVAHEIGTPLHSIAGHLELLRKDLSGELLSEEVDRRLRIVEAQLGRVIEIIAQLLDLTRRPPGEPVPVDVGSLVRDTAELVRPAAAAAGVRLEVAGSAPLPPVRGHGNQLQQVVLNLLTNAMDATAAGGRVAVRTEQRAESGEVVVEVFDTGRGIPANELKQIFEPFFSTKEGGRGTGLGLFISTQIVRDHQGRIEVESEEGRGSTFRMVLPAGRG